jgi:tetratricopeptide (TPR) repeat protein
MKKFFFTIFVIPVCCLAQSSLLTTVDRLIDAKQFVKAEKLLSKSLPDDSKDLDLLERMGDVYGHQKKWQKAAIYYKKLRDLQPSNAEYHYKYGGVLGMKALQNKFKAMGLIGDIKSSFTKAAELDATHVEARWALVELYMQLPGILGGSKRKSLKYADELQNISEVDGYLAKGYVYEYDNEPEKAAYYYKKAISTGGSITCYQKLTDLYADKMKKPDKAIGNIEEAYQKHKRNALHYQIGKVSSDYKVQLDKGLKCLEKYIQNYQVSDGVPLEWAYYRMARIYKHKKDQKNAMLWINKALALRADFKEAKKEKLSIANL